MLEYPRYLEAVIYGRIFGIHVRVRVVPIVDYAEPYLKIEDPVEAVESAERDGINLNHLALSAYSYLRHDVLDILFERYVDINYNYSLLLDGEYYLNPKADSSYETIEVNNFRITFQHNGMDKFYILPYQNLTILDFYSSTDIDVDTYNVLKKHSSKFKYPEYIDLKNFYSDYYMVKLFTESGSKIYISGWQANYIVRHENIINMLLDYDGFYINSEDDERKTIFFNYLLSMGKDGKTIMKFLSRGAAIRPVKKLLPNMYKQITVHSKKRCSAHEDLHNITELLREYEAISNEEIIKASERNEFLKYMRHIITDLDNDSIVSIFRKFIKRVRNEKIKIRECIYSIVMLINLIDKEIQYSMSYFSYDIRKFIKYYLSN